MQVPRNKFPFSQSVEFFATHALLYFKRTEESVGGESEEVTGPGNKTVILRCKTFFYVGISANFGG